MHQKVSKQGYVDVTDQAVSDAGIIVDLTAGFVRSYSVDTAHLSNGMVPSPQLFRANALKHFVKGVHNPGLVSSGVIGFPGREISQPAKDDSKRNLLLLLEASNSKDVVTAVIEEDKQTIHRSLWALYATEQV